MSHSAQNGTMVAPTSAPAHQHIHPANVLKLTGLPSDISQREANLIFSLVFDDIISIDLVDSSITVAFKNPNTCLTAARILDGKFIFGQNQGPIKVEYDASLALSNTTSAFESLRLSNAGISPPSSQTVPQTSVHQHPNSQLPPSSSIQHGSGTPGIDTFPKRASIGNQRSRFLFSDPFSGNTTPTNPNPGSIDLSDLTGNSLLFMKQNDGREYESIPRDPWASQSQGNIGFSSNPQTPGLSSVHKPYDWGSSTAGNLPASANASSQVQQPPPHSQSGSQMQASHSSSGNPQMPPFITSAPGGRRTSSFFNGPTSHVSTQPSLGHDPKISQIQQTSPTVQSQLPSPGPTQQASGSLAPLNASPNTTNRNGSISSGTQGSNTQSVGSSHTASTSQSTNGRSISKDVPDLSLLARVPPPANPADQNPPCNTLYVGNLPPDATETELRSLFAPQKGFRRLSFRTKNQSSSSSSGSSSHNHGPMCFVEFEDVAHATIALAELYGRALPRPNGSNGKGGIRLSFSKNPLGVRGPGNPRRGSTNPQTSSAGGASNGVGNYGYSNYH
ncbi:hypothetical protein JCM33374_g3699 [Metschnikowia sp. JCM 33374]|nr:hypothetical protein JCM33374_g3699 [Metschnikowia sp. JCM 33374]